MSPLKVYSGFNWAEMPSLFPPPAEEAEEEEEEEEKKKGISR